MNTNNNYYNQLLTLINERKSNIIWLENRINLWEQEGYISFREREDLLNRLYN